MKRYVLLGLVLSIVLTVVSCNIGIGFYKISPERVEKITVSAMGTEEIRLDAQETEKLIGSVVDYIRANYSQELTLSILSKKFALSESCLSRKFKSVAGMGLNEFITSVRIHNAEQLLAKGEHSVTRVAELCGYGDSNYFASVFKKIKGTTPVKFAKAQM